MPCRGPQASSVCREGVLTGARSPNYPFIRTQLLWKFPSEKQEEKQQQQGPKHTIKYICVPVSLSNSTSKSDGSLNTQERVRLPPPSARLTSRTRNPTEGLESRTICTIYVHEITRVVRVNREEVGNQGEKEREPIVCILK